MSEARNTERVMRMSEGFSWEGASDAPYKEEGTHFRDVRRVNLAGMLGEQAAFHLRYFEIKAGGYTSKEHHEHVHVIFVVRGEGDILLGEKWQPLKFGDVAYVPPGMTHQMRNDFREPFGFLCVVDAVRDKPVVEGESEFDSICGE